MKNELRVPLPEFKRAMGRFKEYRRIEPTRKGRSRQDYVPHALVAFSGGFLSFEAGDLVAAVRADGEWHGRASFSARFLGVLGAVPPAEDPVCIRYADGKLHICTLVIGCDWDQDGARLVERAENPGPLDLLAMDRTVSRSEIHGTDLGKRITAAKRRVSGAITRASKLLADLEITSDELWTMVEDRIQARLVDRAP
jgi:hypothetical protein